MDKDSVSRENNPNQASSESAAQTASDCFVNVKNFGAIGDGVTDDTLAIKNAIASVEKGTIFFPAGIYAVSPLKSSYLHAITIKSNMRILGSGAGVTTLTFTNSARTNCAVIGIFGGENVTISSLTVDGNKKRTTKKYDIIGEGIEFNGGTKRFWLNDIHIKNTLGEGVDIDEAYDGSISNLVIQDCQGNGLHISTFNPNSERINVSNVTIKNCAHGRTTSERSAAVVLRGGHLNLVNINVVDSDRGFHIDGEGIVNFKPIRITNANVENITRQGVITRNDAPVTYFTNCSFDGGSASYAVRARNEIHFTNCEFKKQSVSPACVSLEENAHNSTFDNCKFKGGSPSLNIVTNGTRITNSTFSNFPQYGLTINNAKNLSITGNTINSINISQGVYFQKITHSVFSLNNFSNGTLFFQDTTFNHTNIITNNIFGSAQGVIDKTKNIYEHNFIGQVIQ